MQCWSYRIWEFYQLLKLCLLWSLYFWWWIIGGYLEIISEDVNIPWWTCQAALHWPLGSPIGNSCKNKAPCLKSEKGIGLTYYRFAMDSLSNRLDEGLEVWIDIISWKMQSGVPWRCANEAQMQWPTSYYLNTNETPPLPCLHCPPQVLTPSHTQHPPSSEAFSLVAHGFQSFEDDLDPLQHMHLIVYCNQVCQGVYSYCFSLCHWTFALCWAPTCQQKQACLIFNSSR